MVVGSDMTPRIMRNVRGTLPRESDRPAQTTRESSNRLPAAAEPRRGVLPGTALEKAWPVTSNGEVERPRRSAGLAPRAHNLFQRPRRPTTHVSRPVPTIVRGRPHTAYCARAVSSAQTLPAGSTETSALTAAASATNAAEAEEITQDLAHGPRALPQSQAKGLCLGSLPLSLSLHRRIWLRPLTVKLRGRTTTPDKRRGRTTSSRVRGAKPQSHHGPLQRLLDGTMKAPEVTRTSISE